jgi:hypothetical protein
MSLSESNPPADHRSDSDILADTVTDDQLARELHVSLATIRRWAALGRLPAKLNLPGRMPRRSREAIKKMIAAGSTPPRRGRRP